MTPRSAFRSWLDGEMRPAPACAREAVIAVLAGLILALAPWLAAALAGLQLLLAAPASAAPVPLPPERPAFPICERGKPRINCVVDGDTLWLNGEKIRIKGLHTPETFAAKCARERRLGDAAKHALARFLWPGPVMLDRTGRDRFGRTLAFVFAAGRDATKAMIAMDHGAAHRQTFCEKKARA